MSTHITGRKATLSPAMLHVLGLASAGKSLYAGCQGRAEHGGRARTILALKDRGYLDADGRLIR